MFSASMERPITSPLFFDKIGACVLQGRNYIKTLVRHRLFSQYILFKAASFQRVFQKEYEVKSLYSRVAVCTL